jgi:site-specific DNA-cytosine methylase
VLLPAVEVGVKILDLTNSFGEDKVREYSDVCPTLRSERHGLCVTDFKITRWSTRPYRIRRLTPRECFRLMGMRDEDINLINSNSQSYKIAGNGIEINTMRSILRSLYKPVKRVNSLF